jgi:hypothetical protein
VATAVPETATRPVVCCWPFCACRRGNLHTCDPRSTRMCPADQGQPRSALSASSARMYCDFVCVRSVEAARRTTIDGEPGLTIHRRYRRSGMKGSGDRFGPRHHDPWSPPALCPELRGGPAHLVFSPALVRPDGEQRGRPPAPLLLRRRGTTKQGVMAASSRGVPLLRVMVVRCCRHGHEMRFIP